jgi:hypothetical protein
VLSSGEKVSQDLEQHQQQEEEEEEGVTAASLLHNSYWWVDPYLQQLLWPM